MAKVAKTTKIESARAPIVDAMTATESAGAKMRLAAEACRDAGIHARDIVGATPKHREAMLGWVYFSKLGERASLCALSGRKAIETAGGNYDGVRAVKTGAAAFLTKVARAVCDLTGEKMPAASGKAGSNKRKAKAAPTLAQLSDAWRKVSADLIEALKGSDALPPREYAAFVKLVDVTGAKLPREDGATAE